MSNALRRLMQWLKRPPRHSMLVMLVSMGAVGGFVERHPSVKILALAFLLLIGVMLVAEGMGQHVPKGYIYFAMGFSVFVEMINLRLRKTVKPVHLKDRYTQDPEPGGGPTG